MIQILLCIKKSDCDDTFVTFRLKDIMPYLTWHIKVLLVVIQKGMRSPFEFFLRMAI